MGLINIGNGEKGYKIRKSLNSNFNYLGKYLKNYVTTLTLPQRQMISSDYLCEGILSFDPDEQIWYQYNDGTWKKTSFYSQDISSSDWIDNQITIGYETHLVSNPIIQIYMDSNNSSIPVIGGYEIDEDNNIILTTDMAYQGKVVIK